MKKFLALMAIALFVVGCVNNSVPRTTIQATATTLPQQTKYIHAFYKFYTFAPAGWLIYDKDPSRIATFYGPNHGSGNASFNVSIVFAHSFFTQDILNLSNHSDANAVYYFAINNFKQLKFAINFTSLDNETPMKVGGLEAYSLSFRIFDNVSGKMEIRQVYLKRGNELLVITLNSAESDFQKYNKVFEEMLAETQFK